MKNKPDPHKAIHLKPHQRTMRRKRKRPSTSEQWQPHRGDMALDAWAVALRDMRARGVSWE